MQTTVVEQQIQLKIFTIDNHPFLTFYKCKAYT